MKLYINGKIHSMDASGSVYSALCEEDGKILGLGDEKDLISRYPCAETVDLQGKTVIPGIIDTHAHLFAAALSEKTRKLFIPKSVSELLSDLKERVKSLPEGEWVIYKNTYVLRLSELRFPTREELDAAAPKNPVVVDGYYASQLNTVALNMIDFEKLPKGAGVEYNDDGSMTGLLKCANPYVTSFVDFGDGCYKKALAALMHEYNKCGITSVIDARSPLDNIKTMKEFQDDGAQTVRVRYTLPANPDLIEATLGTDMGNPELSRAEFVKDFLDGGFLTGTAFMQYPYKNVREVFGIDTKGKEEYGMAQFTVDELCESICLARKHGLKYCAHCVGSAATQRLLYAYKHIDNEQKIKGERHALIHADFLDDSMVGQANDMGVSVLFQPAWHYMDAPALEKVLDERDASRFMRYDVIMNAELYGAGSDHMVKFDPDESVNPYNPFTGMYNMVTCRARDGKQYGAEARISRDAALEAYTRKAAYVSSDEELTGTLEVGKRADFAVLDRDYFTCPEEEIPLIRADMTVFDGKRVV
ncbi:MAG: amidohydrolase family protein [Oscillospiraceae bacterium]|nr:amidohydrolase family protein [Oscillospiraceae bacterium]